MAEQPEINRAWIAVRGVSGINPGTLEDIKNSFDSVIDPTQVALTLLQDGLNLVKALITLYSDPLNALIQEVLDELETFVNDLFSTGLYVIVVDPFKYDFNDAKKNVEPLQELGIADSEGKINTIEYEGKEYPAITLMKGNIDSSVKNSDGKKHFQFFGSDDFPVLTPGQAISQIVSAFDDAGDSKRPTFSDNALVFGTGLLFTFDNFREAFRIFAEMKKTFEKDLGLTFEELGKPFEEWFKKVNKYASSLVFNNTTDISLKDIPAGGLTIQLGENVRQGTLVLFVPDSQIQADDGELFLKDPVKDDIHVLKFVAESKSGVEPFVYTEFFPRGSLNVEELDPFPNGFRDRSATGVNILIATINYKTGSLDLELPFFESENFLGNNLPGPYKKLGVNSGDLAIFKKLVIRFNNDQSFTKSVYPDFDRKGLRDLPGGARLENTLLGIIEQLRNLFKVDNPILKAIAILQKQIAILQKMVDQLQDLIDFLLSVLATQGLYMHISGMSNDKEYNDNLEIQGNSFLKKRLLETKVEFAEGTEIDLATNKNNFTVFVYICVGTTVAEESTKIQLLYDAFQKEQEELAEKDSILTKGYEDKVTKAISKFSPNYVLAENQIPVLISMRALKAELVTLTTDELITLNLELVTLLDTFIGSIGTFSSSNWKFLFSSPTYGSQGVVPSYSQISTVDKLFKEIVSYYNTTFIISLRAFIEKSSSIIESAVILSELELIYQDQVVHEFKYLTSATNTSFFLAILNRFEKIFKFRTTEEDSQSFYEKNINKLFFNKKDIENGLKTGILNLFDFVEADLRRLFFAVLPFMTTADPNSILDKFESLNNNLSVISEKIDDLVYEKGNLETDAEANKVSFNATFPPFFDDFQTQLTNIKEKFDLFKNKYPVFFSKVSDVRNKIKEFRTLAETNA